MNSSAPSHYSDPRVILKADSSFLIPEVQETLPEIIVVLPSRASHLSCTSDLSAKVYELKQNSLGVQAVLGNQLLVCYRAC